MGDAERGARTATTPWRRLFYGSVWHCCPRCSHWPGDAVSVEAEDRTSGRICRECAAKVRRGTCAPGARTADA